ncbi:MAG: serine/threonine-protein kinase [Pseudomonadota bacterium]
MSVENFDIDLALDRLLDADPAAIDDMLQEIATTHPESAARLRRLLGFALGTTTTPVSLDQAAPNLFGQMLAEEDLDRVGTLIGPYKITSLINRGGMGVVFRAERHDGAYEQTVAVKFLPRLAKSASRRDLFLNERANLARLEHPNIARIIDAGLTDDNTPYFVMEYISGEPIDTYCKPLSERHRLQIFNEVCDAVVYCHRSFVVHGDIKPNNILIGEDRVRLLDFGIGKWTKHAGTPGTRPATGFTKGYAAPELEAGEGHTVATDIFGLGILLHEIAGFSKGKSSNNEVDLIVSKCTHLDKTCRYPSVEALKSDIEAVLENHPISILSGSRVYTYKKFLQRNWGATAAMAGVIASLSVGFSLAVWQYQAAELEAQRAKETSAFVLSIFDRINPEDAGAEDLSLRYVMDEASIRIDNELLNAPEVRHDIMALIASAYNGLGDYEKSHALRKQVLDYHLNTKSAPSKEIADALSAFGSELKTTGDYDQARQHLRRAIEQYELLGLDQSLDMAYTLGSYALLMTNRAGSSSQVEVAIKMLERKGEILAMIDPNDQYQKYIHLTNLASGYDEIGNHERAAQLKEDAVALAEQNGLELQMTAITALCNLGYSYDGLGRWNDAIETHRKCIDRRTTRLGADHPELLPARQNLASALIAKGRFSEAKDILEQSVDAAQRQLPEKSFPRLAAEINLARVNILVGDSKSALARLPGILKRMQAATGENSAAAARVTSILGKAYLTLDETQAALVHLRGAYDILADSPYWTLVGSVWTSDVVVWRAQAELAAGNKSDAEAFAQHGLELRQAEANVQNWRLREAAAILKAARP